MTISSRPTGLSGLETCGSNFELQVEASVGYVDQVTVLAITSNISHEYNRSCRCPYILTKFPMIQCYEEDCVGSA